MSSNPPPKEGPIQTTSMKIRQAIHFIQHDKRDKAVELLEQILKDNGYAY